jgi:hypothetical protein
MVGEMRVPAHGQSGEGVRPGRAGGPQQHGGRPQGAARFEVRMALAFDYTAAELLPLLPKVQQAVAGALSLPSKPDGLARVRVAIRGEQGRRLALPTQRRLAAAVTVTDRLNHRTRNKVNYCRLRQRQ